MNVIAKLVMMAVAVVWLSGCQTTSGPASIKGECQAFKNPGFAVRGKRRIDQRAIDIFLETGISVCEWPRPKE